MSRASRPPMPRCGRRYGRSSVGRRRSFLVTGRLHPIKGGDVLLRAWRRLVDEVEGGAPGAGGLRRGGAECSEPLSTAPRPLGVTVLPLVTRKNPVPFAIILDESALKLSVDLSS